jgi:hypothetical protein
MPTREELLDYIKGKEVVIPDLYAIFEDWPEVKVNPHGEKLVPVSSERLKR